jgi:hypothetical protein
MAKRMVKRDEVKILVDEPGGGPCDDPVHIRHCC